MSAAAPSVPGRLVDRSPLLSGAEMVAQLAIDALRATADAEPIAVDPARAVPA